MRNGGSFPQQPGKPQLGTAEHFDWIEGRARVYVDQVEGKPTRRGFVEWSKQFTSSVSNSDFKHYPGGWGGLLRKVRADELDEEAAGAFDFDDVPDTAPGVDVPLPPLLEGYELKGTSTYVDSDGEIRGQWIKTNKVREESAALMRRLTAELPALLGDERAEPAPSPEVHADDMLAGYPMGDPHWGLLTHAAETGEVFNLDLAERLTVDAMRSLVERGPRASTALIGNLGDAFHADDSTNRTRRSGHQLHTDGTFLQTRQAGVRILGTMIRVALEHHDRVIVENVPGNHDDDSAAWLSVALGVWFENEPRVEVVQSPALARYHRHGKNLIGLVHGHNTKHEELGAIMADERPQDWGETVHRHWWCGHLHHTVKKEVRGCTVEVFRTLAARTKFEAGKGYRSGRDMNRITYHREHGEVSREVVSARALLAQYEAEAA